MSGKLGCAGKYGLVGIMTSARMRGFDIDGAGVKDVLGAPNGVTKLSLSSDSDDRSGISEGGAKGEVRGGVRVWSSPVDLVGEVEI